MSYVTWYNEIYIESTYLLFCFDGRAVTILVHSLRADFHTSENTINIENLMGNFFNNGTQFLKLIVRVRIYQILIKI
jgi:hypothetical protein